MPTVPRRDSTLLGARPLQAPRVSTGIPAGALGGLPSAPDLSGIQRHVSKIVEEEQQKADDIAILEADNKLATLQNGLLYDPKTGVLNRRGKNALTADADVDDAWRKETSAIETGLTTERQQLAFRSRLQSRRADLNATVQRHIAGEIQAYDTEQTNAALRIRADDAIKGAGDPTLVARALGETEMLVETYGKRMGWAPEVVEDKRAAAVSRIHVGVISQLLAAPGNAARAAEYFAANKNEIDGEQLDNVEKAVKSGQLLAGAQQKADTIMSAKGVTRSIAFDAAKGIPDPELRRETEQQLDIMWRRREQDAQDRYEAAAAKAFDFIERGEHPPASLWSTLKPSDRAAYSDRLRQMATREAHETDWGTYYELKTLASSETTRDRFLRTNLLAYRSQLGDTEFKELVGLQAETRKGSAKAEEDLGSYRTTAQIVNDGLAGVGIDATPDAKKDQKTAVRVALFRRSVDQQLREIGDRTGKKATPDDAQRIVDNLLVKGVVAGSKDPKFVFERAVGERLVLSIRDVPPGEKARIRDALTRRGLPVTDAGVLKLYLQRIGQIPTFQPPEP